MKKIISAMYLLLIVFVAVPAWSLPFTFTDPIDSIVGWGNTSPSEAGEKQVLANVLGLTVAEVEALYLYDKNESIGAFDYKDLAAGFKPGFSWDYAIIKVDGPNDYWYMFMDDNASGNPLNGDNVLTSPAQRTLLAGDLYFNRPNLGISHVTWFKTMTQVPEPTLLFLLGVGLIGLAGVKRKLNK